MFHSNKVKIGSLVLLLSLLFSFVLVSAYEKEHYSNSTIYRRILAEYKNDKQFQLMKKKYGQHYANNFLKNVYDKTLKEQEKGGGGNYCYAKVKNIRQTKNYNCGPTTVLQTLYGLNSEDAVLGNSDAKKIATIENEYGVGQSGMMVYQIVDALNKYNLGYGSYSYVIGSHISRGAFVDKVANALTHGRPVVLHALTGSLDYYGGKNLRHYLSIEAIDRIAGTIDIVDCNYKNEFFGRHRVKIDDAYECINSTTEDRYLIY